MIDAPTTPHAQLEQYSKHVAEAADYILAHTRYTSFDAAIILGSGLSGLADQVTEADVLPYASIPYMAMSTVPGHAGRLVLGRLGGATVWIMQGRLHYYEGHSWAQIVFPLRIMQHVGLDTLIVTNAAGGIRADLRAGDLMLIMDHLNLVGMAGNNPLRGPNDDTFGPRFPSMSNAYDAGLARLARRAAHELQIDLREGIYAMVAGPNFETPAEVRFLRLIGADAVGMSTVPEVLVARHGGLRVLGLSLISNVAVDTLPAAVAGDGISGPAPALEATHEEVLEAGRMAAPKLTALIQRLIERITGQ